jgi:hypothetical protein
LGPGRFRERRGDVHGDQNPFPHAVQVQVEAGQRHAEMGKIARETIRELV